MPKKSVKKQFLIRKRGVANQMSKLLNFFKIYKDSHYKRVTHSLALRIKPFLSKKDIVLDLGSGNGYMADAIKNNVHCKITRMDVVDVSKIGPKPILYDGLHILASNNTFSVSLVIFVLHHLQEKEFVLKELSRVTTSKIIIVEDIAQDIFDYILGIWHKITSRIRYKSSYISYRTDQEWKDLFKKLNLNIIFEGHIDRFIEPIHPASKKLYVLQKKK